MTLRPVQAADTAAIAAIYAPHVERGTASFEKLAPGPGEMARRMEEKAGLFPWLVCEEAGRVVGYAYAGRLGARPGYDWSSEVSIYIEEGHARAGAGRALYTALLALLAAQGYRNAYAVVACPNPASEAFHQAMGFVRQSYLENCGYKFGAPLSVAHYCRVLLPVCENPPPPRPLSALSAQEVAACLTAK